MRSLLCQYSIPISASHVCCLAISFFIVTTSLKAEEVTVFNMTDVEGYFGLGYTEDSTEKGTSGTLETHSKLTTTQEEFSIRTHSYVYHPNFLKVDLGGGLTYTQNELESSVGNREYDEELYSLSAYLRFLEKKSYPVTLYYDRSNPSVSYSVTERFVQEHEKYGINASILEPLMPFSVELNAYRQTSRGEGETQVMNDKSDHVFLRAYGNIGKDGHGQLTYQSNKKESSSGNRSLSPTTTYSDSESFSFDNRFLLGERRQIDFNSIISYFTQEGILEREEFRFAPNLNWNHSKLTYSYYRLDYADSKIDSNETETTNATVGVSSELAENLGAGLQFDSAKTDMTGLQSSTNSLSTNVNYAYPFTNGKFSISAGLRQSESERKADESTAGQIGEQVRLDGLTRVALLSQHIISSTVRVWNENRTTEYTVDVHFRVIQVGNTTYIERIVTGGLGDIPDGSTVLVDYSYDTGGTVAYSTTNQNYHAGLELFKYYIMYIDYSDTDHELESGTSTVPLNSSVYRRYGVRVDHPFRFDTIRLGGEVTHDERDEEVTSYEGDSQELFFQMKLTSNLSLHLNEYRLQRDNFDTKNNVDLVEDIDLKRRTARLTTRPWPRSFLTLEWMREEDTGGTSTRRYEKLGLTGEWRFRQLIFTLDGRTVDETYGSSERRHNVFSAQLRRTF